MNHAGLDHFYKVLRVTAQYELCALRSACLWLLVKERWAPVDQRCCPPTLVISVFLQVACASFLLASMRRCLCVAL